MIGLIADAAPALAGHPAGRGRGGEVAVGIERDRADGAEQMRGVDRRLLLARHASNCCQRSSVRNQAGSTCSSPLLEREAVGAVAREHHVRAVVHHRAREVDRVARARDPGDRAGLLRLAVHDRGIEFILALGGEHRAAPALNSGLSSSTRTAAATASSAAPPLSSTALPVRSASSSPAR